MFFDVSCFSSLVIKKLKCFFIISVMYSNINTMSSTRIFINYEDNEDYDYYKRIEDEVYFTPINNKNLKRIGDFRVHGKYTSTFHAGRIPNEYYCLADQAMTLRSGRKLNHVKNNFFWTDAIDLSQKFDGSVNWRCYHLKKAIWFYENYYHLLSSCYHLVKVYDISVIKVKEFLEKLDTSVKGVYKERKFTTVERDGEIFYEIDNSEPMPVRDTEGEGKYTFCKCRYTAIEGDKAIDQEGHHVDEFLPKLRKLMKMYSKPHRIVTDSSAFKFVNRRINDDCRALVFSFLEAQDVKA